MNDAPGFVGSVIGVALRRKRIWLAQGLGNVALFALFYLWLRIPDQNGWQVAATALLGLVVALGTLSLHGGTLVYFREAHESTVGSEASLRNGCRRALSHWFPLATWSLIFGTLLCFVGIIADHNGQTAGWLHHLLPAFLRRTVSVRFVDGHMDLVTSFCAWVLVPLLLLPLAAQLASHGWRGFLRADVLRALRTSRYWLMAIVLLLIGGPLAYSVASHASKGPSLGGQAFSMTVRFLVAYLIALTCWILLCSTLGWFGQNPGPAPVMGPDSGPDDEIGVREPVGVSPPARRAGAKADLE